MYGLHTEMFAQTIHADRVRTAERRNARIRPALGHVAGELLHSGWSAIVTGFQRMAPDRLAEAGIEVVGHVEEQAAGITG